MNKWISQAMLIGLLLTANSLHAQSAVESLSPELRALLGKEMVALQGGMQALIPAYASGDFEAVARIAHDIKNSFVLKQAITDAQKQELMSKLPGSFLRLDEAFHEYAGMLEHVAHERRAELVGFYFYRLTDSCIGCHSQFAVHRFPELAVSKAETHGHH